MLCTMGPKFYLITFKFSNVSQEFLEEISNILPNPTEKLKCITVQ